MHQSDRMDVLIAAAVRSGFSVWQTATGSWLFRKGILTTNVHRTPVTPGEWAFTIKTLQGAGLSFRLFDEEAEDV